MKKKKKTKNYGLKIDEIKPEDYVFGSILSPVPFEEINPDGDWTSYLPVRELQNFNGTETYACVSFSILNCIETLIKKKYNEEKNYSDRFLAAISGTKEGGNSPQIVCEFLRKIGVVPEELWPFDDKILNRNGYYAPIPPKLYELAREFNTEWEFKHEFVPSTDEAIEKALKCSPLGISVYAWQERGNMYYKPEGVVDNHFTTLIMTKNGQYKRVFDSYDNFIKDYEWDTKHSVIKRFYVSKRIKKKSWLDYLKDWFREIWK